MASRQPIDRQLIAAAVIADEYEEAVRRTYSTGPNRDRLVNACPDGRTVVIERDGTILADSREES